VALNVRRADGRRPERWLPAEVAGDVCLFSPPYPNNIDYTEVYKMEAWLLGLIPDQETFRRERLATVRSHASVLNPDRDEDVPPELRVLLRPLISSLPNDRYLASRRQTFLGYFHDMSDTLINLRGRLSKGADVVIVVGNSLHGSTARPLPVAADVLIAEIARYAGFSVRQIALARRPFRRTAASSWIRESVLFLRSD
jgi:hypothetical protein